MTRRQGIDVRWGYTMEPGTDLSEHPSAENAATGVQPIDNRIRIFLHGGSEDDKRIP
jgi:hypothetical protein